MSRVGRMVLVQDSEGNTLAIGPVAKDETVNGLRELATDAGLEPLGEAVKVSIAEFYEICAEAREAQLEAVRAGLEESVAAGDLEKVGDDEYRITEQGRHRVENMLGVQP